MRPGYTRKTLSYQQCLRVLKLIHSWDIICCNPGMTVVLRPPRDGPSQNVDRMGARVGPLADLYQRKKYDRRWRELLLTCFRSRHVAPKLYEGAASIEYFFWNWLSKQTSSENVYKIYIYMYKYGHVKLEYYFRTLMYSQVHHIESPACAECGGIRLQTTSQEDFFYMNVF